MQNWFLIIFSYRNLNFNINKVPNLTLFHLLSSELWLTSDAQKTLIDNDLNYGRFQTSCLLKSMDTCWSKHLEKMSELREATRWQAYAQKDPFMVYKEEAMKMFNDMNDQILNLLIRDLLLYDII